MRVVSIKCPPSVIDGIDSDNFPIGSVYDVSPNLAIRLIAAGWMRGETRTRARRAPEDRGEYRDRRQLSDRRSETGAQS